MIDHHKNTILSRVSKYWYLKVKKVRLLNRQKDNSLGFDSKLIYSLNLRLS